MSSPRSDWERLKSQSPSAGLTARRAPKARCSDGSRRNAARTRSADRCSTPSSEKLNAQAVNKARDLPKTKVAARIRRECRRPHPSQQALLRQLRGTRRARRHSNARRSRRKHKQGIFRYNALDNTIRMVNVLDIARANGLPSTHDPFVAQQLAIVNQALSGGDIASLNLVQNTFRFINPNTPNVNYYPTARFDYQANSNPGAARSAQPALPRPAAQPAVSRPRTERRLHLDLLHRGHRGRLDDFSAVVQSTHGRVSEQLRRIQPGEHAGDLRTAGGPSGQPATHDLPGRSPTTSCRSRATTRSTTFPTPSPGSRVVTPGPSAAPSGARRCTRRSAAGRIP